MGDLILPKFYAPGSFPGTPISCSLVMIDTFTPINYVPTGSGVNLGQHLGGIDAKLGILVSSFSSINATGVIVNSFSPVNYIPGTTALTSFLQAIDTRFGNINTTLPKDFGAQLLTDGDSGKFNADITNMSAADVTLSQDNTVYHDPSAASSLKALSTSTATKSITHTDEIEFLADQEYELSAYVFVPAADFPDGAVVSMTVGSGTGIIRKTKTLTVNSGTSGMWSKISTRFIPDENQERDIVISVTGFTDAKILNFDDVTASIVPGKRLGYLAPYSIVSLTNLAAVYNRMGTSFVADGGEISTDGGSFDVVVEQSEYVLNGRTYWMNEERLTVASGSDNYIYYNSFNDEYVIKSVANEADPPKTDDEEIILAKLVTNFAGVTTNVPLLVTAPYAGSHIKPDSISTAHIINSAVTDAKLSTTGVAAASYIFANIMVSSRGRITAASSAVSLDVPFDHNLLRYNSSTGKFENTASLILQNNPASLVDDSVLNSSSLTFRGYYDSTAGAGITATNYDAVIQHFVTDTSPQSKLHFTIGGTAYLKYTSKGVIELLNAVSAPSLIATGNVIYSDNVALVPGTKSVLHVVNEFGHTIKLMRPNSYTLTYATEARTLNAYTPDTESGAYTGLDNLQGGTPYAKLDDLNALRTAYENLRTSYDNLISVLTAMNVDLKAIGFFG